MVLSDPHYATRRLYYSLDFQKKYRNDDQLLG